MFQLMKVRKRLDDREYTVQLLLYYSITHLVGTLLLFINRYQKSVRIYDRFKSTIFPIGHRNRLSCELGGGGGAGMEHKLLNYM